MSILNEIKRLQSAKANIKQSLEENGIAIDDKLKLNDYGQIIYDALRNIGGSGVDYSMYAKQIQLRPAAITQNNVTFNLDNVTTLAMLFNSTLAADDNIAVKNITVNCPNKIEAMNAAFFCNRTYNDNVLEKVTLNVDTSNCTTIRLAFRGCRALKTIDGTPLDLSKCTASNATENTFQYCYALQDVGFAKETIKVNTSFANCSELSDESIQSIIDGLADLTGGTAQTLTLHATVGAKLTDEQKATITAKNWTLVY